MSTTFIIHDLDRETAREVSREHMENDLGPTLMDLLEERGSMSCGMTVYECRREKAPVPAAPIKAPVTLQHMSPITQAPQQVSRDRAAYLMRAARSRRRHNITTVSAHTYTLDDCSHLVRVHMAR